jgi:four helix bundle protein
VASEFRNLVAHRLAVELADELCEAIARWPKFERWSIGMQLARAADSIGANIAESSGRWHGPDKRRLLLIARGSLYETEHFVERAKARGLLAAESAAQLTELSRALNGLVKKWTQA